jgi:TatD DNase family protein
VFFVDTHCHLNFESFDSDLNEVVARAVAAGVNRIVVPGLDLISSEKAVKIANQFENVYAAVGVHPNSLDTFEKDHLQRIEALAIGKKVVAIGEIGLDFYHHPETKPAQLELMEYMMDIATKVRKPVILHSRNSTDDLISIIERFHRKNPDVVLVTNTFSGVFHAFDGTLEQAEKVRSMGFFLGFGGPLTYKNADQKRHILQELGLTNVVLETDAPFLTPEPFRGKRNEPAYIPLIAEKSSKVLNQSLESVSLITSSNANSLFNWDTIN